MKARCALFVFLLMSGCSVTDAPKKMSFDSNQRWVLLPIKNNSGTAQASEQVGAILGADIRNRGLTNVKVCPELDAVDAIPELDEQRRYERALKWAQKSGFALGITGSVEEWHYRNGAEGEPATALVIEVVDIATGQVVWNATGSRSGWGRETLSGTGQKLLRDLFASLNVRNDSNDSR